MTQRLETRANSRSIRTRVAASTCIMKRMQTTQSSESSRNGSFSAFAWT